MPNYVLDSSAADVNNAINKVVNITEQPTAGNDNVVKSSGVKTYVDNAAAAVQSNVDAITKTVNGVTTTGAVLFTKSFSGTIALTGDSVTGQTAHGLGAQPFLFNAYYKCKVANNGYNVGDLLNVDTTNSSHHINYWADATNLYIRTAFEHYIVDADGGTIAKLTSTNWEIEFRAIL